VPAPPRKCNLSTLSCPGNGREEWAGCGQKYLTLRKSTVPPRLITRKAVNRGPRQADGMIAGRNIGTALRSAHALAPAAILTACAHQPPAQGGEAGFFSGLFQGLTALFSLAASLFLPVRPYAFPNDGFWYDAGFCLGFSASIVLLVVLLIARVGGLITRGH